MFLVSATMFYLWVYSGFTASVSLDRSLTVEFRDSSPNTLAHVILKYQMLFAESQFDPKLGDLNKFKDSTIEELNIEYEKKKNKIYSLYWKGT